MLSHDVTRLRTKGGTQIGTYKAGRSPSAIVSMEQSVRVANAISDSVTKLQGFPGTYGKMPWAW